LKKEEIAGRKALEGEYGCEQRHSKNSTLQRSRERKETYLTLL